MEQVQLAAKPREGQTKGINRRLRAAGRIPAVVYGGEGENRLIDIEHHALDLILRGARHSNAIFHLTLEGGGEEQVLIREVSRHPVHSRFVHVDFLRVDLSKPIEVSVTLHATGNIPLGVREGGILEHVHRSVTIRALPAQIPSHIEADLASLALNQTFHVSDLKLPEGIEVLDDAETPLFTVLPPKVEAEPVAADAAEPVVLTEKKAEAKEGDAKGGDAKKK